MELERNLRKGQALRAFHLPLSAVSVSAVTAQNLSLSSNRVCCYNSESVYMYDNYVQLTMFCTIARGCMYTGLHLKLLSPLQQGITQELHSACSTSSTSPVAGTLSRGCVSRVAPQLLTLSGSDSYGMSVIQCQKRSPSDRCAFVSVTLLCSRFSKHAPIASFAHLRTQLSRHGYTRQHHYTFSCPTADHHACHKSRSDVSPTLGRLKLSHFSKHAA